MAETARPADSPFSPLDPSLRQIRLLRVNPDPSDLSAVLEIVSLDDDPKYTALSYTWGTDYPDGAGITLRGPEHTSRVPMTRNLQAVLQHLCAAAASGAHYAAGEGDKQQQQQQPIITLWVDALCINQADTAEKSHQITLMRDVYSRAEETCIWLGAAAGDSDLAMTTIGELYTARTYVLPADDSLSEAQIRAINALMAREWWSRIWVVQGRSLCPPSQLHATREELIQRRLMFNFLQRPCCHATQS